ncbi:hypothetical protein OAB00_01030 [Akkermansiaceae bacterium]|nr:hypothetical protein [Akkermansiaceae bacterium]
MKWLLLTTSILALISCDKFSQSKLVNLGFSENLSDYVDQYESEYSDGLLLLRNVDEGDAVYEDFFSAGYEEGNVTISFLEKEFTSNELGMIRYSILDGFDGFSKTIFYSQKLKLMGFGYSDGLM